MDEFLRHAVSAHHDKLRNDVKAYKGASWPIIAVTLHADHESGVEVEVRASTRPEVVSAVAASGGIMVGTQVASGAQNVEHDVRILCPEDWIWDGKMAPHSVVDEIATPLGP